MNLRCHPYAFCAPAVRPCWSGLYTADIVGYEMRGWLFKEKVPIWSVALSKDFPLCLHASDGRTYRPSMCIPRSDAGSIPLWVQRLRIPCVSLKRDTFPKTYFTHDDAYVTGGLWVWSGDAWKFEKFPRELVDRVLRDGLTAEGANAGEQVIIYGGVRLGGWYGWDRRQG